MITVDDRQRDVAGYLGRVRARESLLVLEDDRPIAETRSVVPAEGKKSRPPRQLGLVAGEVVVPDDFDAPLPEEIHRAFKGLDVKEGRGKPYLYKEQTRIV